MKLTFVVMYHGEEIARYKQELGFLAWCNYMDSLEANIDCTIKSNLFSDTVTIILR